MGKDRLGFNITTELEAENTALRTEVRKLHEQIERLRENIAMAEGAMGISKRLIDTQELRIEKLEKALTRLRDCDWVISLPDRMDAVRKIAREALAD